MILKRVPFVLLDCASVPYLGDDSCDGSIVAHLQVRLRDIGVCPNGSAVPLLLPLLGPKGRPQGSLQVWEGGVLYKEGDMTLRTRSEDEVALM